MDLFNTLPDKNKNYLPKDGTVNYYGKVLNQKDADYYLKTLLDSIEWRNDEAIIYGKRIITKRKVAWYGDKQYEYTYSNTTKFALPWTKELLELKLLLNIKQVKPLIPVLYIYTTMVKKAWPGIVTLKKI